MVRLRRPIGLYCEMAFQISIPKRFVLLLSEVIEKDLSASRAREEDGLFLLKNNAL